ncbi:MAG: glycosyltransferase family 2 protein, partial [Pseudomonadota bacterium]
MSKDPIVSIIIVSYNTCEMTLEAIRSAQEQTKAVCEFIVVDNASEDGSAEAIGKTFPHIKLLAEKVNHGFAKANNIAAKHATGEFLLLLNPDTVTLDGAIDKLIAFAERRPEAKIWGGRTLYGDMSLNTTNCWNHMTVWSLFCSAFGLSKLFHGSSFFNPEGYGNWDRSTERDVGFVTGCFLMIRREFWNALEGFDLSFKMY